MINLQTDSEVSFHPKMEDFPVWSWSTPQSPDVRKIKNVNKNVVRGVVQFLSNLTMYIP